MTCSSESLEEEIVITSLKLLGIGYP
jgi:hypothetical protein